jgi:hypothetical protein
LDGKKSPIDGKKLIAVKQSQIIKKNVGSRNPNLLKKGTTPDNQWDMVATKSDREHSEKGSLENQLLTSERNLGDNLGGPGFLANLQ